MTYSLYTNSLSSTKVSLIFIIFTLHKGYTASSGFTNDNNYAFYLGKMFKKYGINIFFSSLIAFTSQITPTSYISSKLVMFGKLKLGILSFP